MPYDDEGDHEVGYGKPPRHSQFVKGQSGNPRGRPPGAKNLKTLLNKALNELVIVTENGGRRKVSKREAIVTQLVNRSAKADYKAIQILLGMLRDIEGNTDPHPSDAAFTEADLQIIQRRLSGRPHKQQPRRHAQRPGQQPDEVQWSIWWLFAQRYRHRELP